MHRHVNDCIMGQEIHKYHSWHLTTTKRGREGEGGGGRIIVPFYQSRALSRPRGRSLRRCLARHTRRHYSIVLSQSEGVRHSRGPDVDRVVVSATADRSNQSWWEIKEARKKTRRKLRAHLSVDPSRAFVNWTSINPRRSSRYRDTRREAEETTISSRFIDHPVHSRYAYICDDKASRLVRADAAIWFSTRERRAELG